jgi:hypothetical protein
MSNTPLTVSLNAAFRMAPAMTPERAQIVARVTERLNAIRKDWSWLGRQLGESPQTMNNWRNERGVPAAKYAAVAKVLGWKVERLLGKEAEDPDEWPFPHIPPSRFDRLNDGQLLQLEGVLLEKLDEFDSASEKHRHAATQRIQQNHDLRPGRNRKTAT